MAMRRRFEKGITGLIVIGLIIFAFGIMSWIFNYTKSMGMPFEATLALLGLIVILLGILTAKIFSEVHLFEQCMVKRN